MVAGDWISDPAAVEKVVRKCPFQIEELIEWGVNLTRKKTENSTCTKKEAIQSSVFCITRTIQGLKSRPA